MNEMIHNYTFTIIEDGQVPLAGDFSTFNYTPLFTVVMLVLIAVVLILYSMWVFESVNRMSELGGENQSISGYYFRPIRLIGRKRELEYEAMERAAHYLA